MKKNLLLNQSMYHECLAATLVSIGHGILTTDLEGTITYMNDSAENLTGFKVDEAVGQNINLILPIIDEASNKTFDSYVKMAIKNNRISGVGVKGDCYFFSKDGVKKYLSASCSPNRDFDGNITGVVVVARDISCTKEVEEDLEIERNNFRSMFEASPMGIAVVDKEIIVKKVNPAFLKIFGSNFEKIFNNAIGNVFVCENSYKDSRGCGYSTECLECRIRNIVKKVILDKTQHNESEIQINQVIKGKLASQCLNINFVPTVFSNEDNVMLVIEDVTDRKKSEDMLRRSKNYYVDFLEDFPSMAWRSNIKKEISFVNKSLLDFIGLKKEDAVGVNWKKLIHPDEMLNVVGAFDKASNEKSVYRMEHRLLHNDKRYIWVESMAKPYYDLNGVFSGYIGIIYDIDERKKYEISLEESRNVYLSSFENFPGLVWRSNKDHIMDYYNKKWLEYTGRSLEEELQTPWTLKQHPDDREVCEAICNKYSELHSSFDLEYRLQIHDGSYRWIWDRRSPIYNMNGEFSGYIGVCDDITHKKNADIELKRAKEAAEAANKAKSQFLANMSHEIRTPLNGMVGMIDLTIRSELNRDQRDNLTIAKSCANSLLKVINDILDFSKMEAGKLTIENESFNLESLMQDVIRVHTIKAEEKGLELLYKSSSGIPENLIGDPMRLKQVLNNLIGNAIKFTDTGNVLVAIKENYRNEDTVELLFSVSDTGIGIPKNKMDLLFKSFSQVDSSYTRKFGGTGLGLVISEQLIEMMGGKIWVESKERCGSTFYFTIKLNIGIKVDVGDVVQKSELTNTLSYNILVVEDDKVNQMVVEHFLRDKGHKLAFANNGKEAVSAFEKGKYDLILMDIQLPEMDGIQATAEIRKIEAKTGGHVPIIALTAYALNGDKEKFLSHGMDAYISKPIDSKLLYETIERLGIKSKQPESNNILDMLNINILANKNEIELNKDEIKKINSDLRACLLLLKDAYNNRNSNLIESCSQKLRSLSNRINNNEIKNLAFKVKLAIRRGNFEEVEKLIKELELKCQDLI